MRIAEPGTKFEGPEDSPGFLFWRLTNAWQRRQRAALAPLDLTHVQFVLLAGLWWLGRSGREIAQVDLARHCGADAMMVSQVLRSLEKRFLINRARSKTDSRARALSLSTSGAQLLVLALPAVEAADFDFFSKVTDRPGLLALLRILAAAL